MSEIELPNSYACCSCGAEHKFPMYVFAHWREVLSHTCDKCGAEHEICAGRADPVGNVTPTKRKKSAPPSPKAEQG